MGAFSAITGVETAHKRHAVNLKREGPTLAHLSGYRVRRARESDIDDLIELAALSGPGMTSLPNNPDYLAKRLARAGSEESGDHLLMLEHLSDRRVVGCAAVKARSGGDAHWNFSITPPPALDGVLHADSVLTPTDRYKGDSELGSLFLHPDYREKGVGRFLSLSRYMLIAAQPYLFSDMIWSELRGCVSDTARSPFYDAVMGPLLGIPFRLADKRFALDGDADIERYLPRLPVRIGDLPKSAQAVIGKTHASGVGARRLLEVAGLRYSGIVDLFEGGPLMAARQRELKIVRYVKGYEIPADTDHWMTASVSGGEFECSVEYSDKACVAREFGAPFFF